MHENIGKNRNEGAFMKLEVKNEKPFVIKLDDNGNIGEI